MREVFIIDGVRTPIGKYGGALSGVRADDLAAVPIRELLRRSSFLDPAAIDDVIMGCANQAGEDNRNVARMAALLAGLPPTVPGMTVNRLCASGMSAVTAAAQAIATGSGDVFIAGGVEQMTRAPYAMPKPEYAFARTPEIFDTTLGWRFINPSMRAQFGVDSMGETAENVAEKFGISRDAQDRFAFNSQRKAKEAGQRGRFKAEITAVKVPQKKGPPGSFEEDEYLRPDTTHDALLKLKPAFREGGSVTAGNSSGINDGACALLLASPEAVKRFNFTPKAKFLGAAVAGVEPKLMGIGPVPATKKLLARLRHPLESIDVIELNEAFAAQCLATMQELGLASDDPRVNPNGGAIALGHPLGMSGARLIMTALLELELQKKSTALCTMCVGVGQGAALMIERV